MKKWLISLSVLCVHASMAQNLLLENNKTWSCYGDYFFINVKYRLGSDTLIHNKVFRKVMAQGSDVPFEFNADSAVYKSALREQGGKVWVVEKGFITEQLLYDFSKTTGDTIRFYRPTGSFTQGVLPYYTIGKIYKSDLVQINGVMRKRLFIHDPAMVDMLPTQALSQLDPQADVWIEGIGGKTGLFSRMPEWGVVGSQPNLLACVDLNGSSLYSNSSGYTASDADPCFILPPGSSGGGGGGSGGIDSLILSIANSTPSELSCFPNPAKDWVIFSPLQNIRTEISLYASNGVRYSSKTEYVHGEEIRLSLHDVPSGIYRVRISQEKQVYWMKLMKE